MAKRTSWQTPPPARTPRMFQDIGYMADKVIAGDVVETDLNDGSFVALMEELKRRGYKLKERAADDPEKQYRPWLFRVAKSE